MSRRLVDKVAANHTMIAGKIYHWGKNEAGKRALHPGLQGKCMVCDPFITTTEPK